MFLSTNERKDKMKTKQEKKFTVGKLYAHPMTDAYFAVDGKVDMKMAEGLSWSEALWTVARISVYQIDGFTKKFGCSFAVGGTERLGCVTLSKFVRIRTDESGREFFTTDIAGISKRIYPDLLNK